MPGLGPEGLNHMIKEDSFHSVMNTVLLHKSSLQIGWLGNCEKRFAAQGCVVCS